MPQRPGRGADPLPVRIALTALIAAATLVAAACQPGAGGGERAAAPADEEGRALYALGAAAARPLEPFSLTPEEADQVASGFRDAVRGEELAAEPEAYRSQIQALGEERQQEAVAEESARAEQFVTRAAQQEGAQQTPSGLVFLEREAGEGASPEPTSTVVVHYHGTFADGEVFDSSVERGEPARFPLDRVIPCWQEALTRMREGGRARIVCPPSIAYGDAGAPPRIPGGAALAFDVELIDVVEEEPAG